VGAVQRLATVVIVGLVALATLLVLYVADESNRIDATALQQRDDGITRATASFVSLCMTCHGPAGLGYTGPDSKTANGDRTGRIGALLGGENTVLNHTGIDAKGTPYAGQTELGVTYSGGFAGRTAWITNRITNGQLTADGKSYIMPAFSETKGGPLNDAQIQELVWMIQYGDWNKIYNQAIATSGGYPTPGPGPVTVTPAAAAATTPAPAGGATGAAAPINLDLEDIKFSTNSLQITANSDATIHVTNKGGIVHNFNIDELNIHSGDVASGASVDVKINAAAGSYTYYCNIPGHEAAGMKGTLTVAAGPPAGSASPPAGAASPAAGSASPAAGAASPTAGIASPAAGSASPTAGIASPAAGSASPSAGAASPAAGVAGASVSLMLEDIKFSTNTLQIPTNTDAVIHITNSGATVHNFSIDELKINTGDVMPGASIDVKINAPAGSYTYYCNVPAHRAAGMQGTLTVK